MFDLRLISIGSRAVRKTRRVVFDTALPRVHSRFHADCFVVGRRKYYRPSGSGLCVACDRRTPVLVHREYHCDPSRFLVEGCYLFRVDFERKLVAQVTPGDIDELKGYGVICLN